MAGATLLQSFLTAYVFRPLVSTVGEYTGLEDEEVVDLFNAVVAAAARRKYEPLAELVGRKLIDAALPGKDNLGDHQLALEFFAVAARRIRVVATDDHPLCQGPVPV